MFVVDEFIVVVEDAETGDTLSHGDQYSLDNALEKIEELKEDFEEKGLTEDRNIYFKRRHHSMISETVVNWINPNEEGCKPYRVSWNGKQKEIDVNKAKFDRKQLRLLEDLLNDKISQLKHDVWECKVEENWGIMNDCKKKLEEYEELDRKITRQVKQGLIY